MKIKLKKTPEQVALVKALASNSRLEALEAQEAFAEFVGPVIQQVLNQAPTLSSVYSDLEFDQYSSPTIPLDQYFDIKETEYVRVWSQTMPGGLPTQMTHGLTEMTFTTYPLNTAVAFLKKYAAQARLDVVSNTLTRMAQEVLIKQEVNAAAVLLRALAGGESTVGGGTSAKTFKHVLRSTTAGQFQLKDFNRLFTLIKRIRSSWHGGTADRRMGRGLTDVFVSPEIVEFFRNMSFNAIYTGTKSDIAPHEKLREQIYEASGVPNFYGVNVIEINELGSGYKFNKLFDAFADGKTYGDGAGTAFDEATEEICIGLDRGMDVLKRPVEVAQNIDVGPGVSQFTVMPDDQFVTRSEKIGFWGKMREGRIVLDDRALIGLIV